MADRIDQGCNLWNCNYVRKSHRPRPRAADYWPPISRDINSAAAQSRSRPTKEDSILHDPSVVHITISQQQRRTQDQHRHQPLPCPHQLSPPCLAWEIHEQPLSEQYLRRYWGCWREERIHKCCRSGKLGQAYGCCRFVQLQRESACYMSGA